MPERARSDKGALSTAIGAARVTLPISESSSDKAMAFQFVHTADVHLDSPLATLALRDPELADLIGGATRKAFVAVIDLCLSEQVDALLIAGDLYDGEQTSMKTARFLVDQLRRLHEAGVKTFIIRGNHDAESRITRELTLPEFGQGLCRARGSRVARPRRARGVGSWREFRQQARAREPVAEVPPAGFRKRQYRHAAHERRRLAGSRPLRALRACGSPWRRLRLLGARPRSSAVRGAGQGGDRDAGKSPRARHQRGRPEVGDAGDDRR